MGVELVLFLCAGSSVRWSLQLQDHPHATTRQERSVSLSMSHAQVEWIYDQLFSAARIARSCGTLNTAIIACDNA
ncbi:MAG: hypothetical protein ACI9DC_005021 [Gammaproteobacteria bacterium]|jgi:hypothetical protein